MFNVDIWQEIFHTIRKNKLRSFLTGFSIATGIFMLVFLLGISRGIQNGAQKNFMDEAKNSVSVYGGRTNLEYKGTNPGKYIQLKNSDFDVLKSAIKPATSFAYETYIPSVEIVSYENNFGNFDINPVSASYNQLERVNILEGRFLNEQDLEKNRKVIVIEDKVKQVLSPKRAIMGKSITINGIKFKVVGIFSLLNFEFGEGSGSIYMPGSTAQMLFGSPDHLTQIGFLLNDISLNESVEIEHQITRILAARHNFNPNDLNALWINNNIENTKEFTSVFKGIESAIWLIGIFTLILGIIGVFNIMMIVVKERTKEIGIRKAIGASPKDVIQLILTESVFITSVSGYIGLIAGIGLLECIIRFDIIRKFSSDVAMFIVNPQVDMGVVVSATLILVVFGSLAGYLPARNAARIRPVEALRDE